MIKQTNKRKVVYKKIKQLVPHCGVCGEELQGNNSYYFQYKCSCGLWKSSFSNPTEYEVVKEDRENADMSESGI